LTVIDILGRKKPIPAWLLIKLEGFFKLTPKQRLARSCCYHEALHRYVKKVSTEFILGIGCGCESDLF
jgi:hypothetical protein